ncbi:MAG: NapC/NirT family cytochrome c [Chloroflexi bacterium]|nr:NapC/NirT family cytochrome c [Chloroflexota bacterium]
MKRLFTRIRNFFYPPQGSPRWRVALPYAVLGALTIGLITGSVWGWEYTNSPLFCGTTCHTMPPEYSAYLVSPHARVDCVDCHIGRDVISVKVTRKAGDVRHIVSLAFQTYHYPIFVKELRPARDSCERCHYPAKFSDDKLIEIKHYGDDVDNSPTSIFLAMKTGGGTKRQGLGYGIHWHVENVVEFYATDVLEQSIPYIRVTDAEGRVTEYTDLSANFDRALLDKGKLVRMDCITCHNRITHNIPLPDRAVDSALSRGLISTEIPIIRQKAVEILQGQYPLPGDALAAIDDLDSFYARKYPDFYAANSDQVKQAIGVLNAIYTSSVFPHQKVDWNTHPNNLGHKDWPGCFRCHDGKHVTSAGQAIRLECNLCHTIPDVATAGQFLTRIEINRGPEPQSHLNTHWIARHRTFFDQSCSSCHNTANPGGTDNSSFCSNSACHGTTWKFVGFDAPGLAQIIAEQLPAPTPAPTPVPAPVAGPPTYTANIQPLFQDKCSMCHGPGSLVAGMDLTTYEGAMKGSQNGPVIKPGDSANSKLIQVQSGEHFAKLSSDELALVKQWIDGGAVEK